MSVSASSYDPAIHHRRSIRLRGHDYSGPGAYFLTICVADNRPLFGTIINERMALNDAGRIAAHCWREIPNHFPHTRLDEWIIMPNHIHGIIIIPRTGEKSFAPPQEKSFAPPKKSLPPTAPPIRPRGTSRTIGSIVRGFKIGVTKSLDRKSPWQRNYYDIIIRDGRAMANIRRYIRNNPSNHNIHRYGKPRFYVGNPALLKMPITTFLASRRSEDSSDHDGASTPLNPTQWPDRPQCVASGFLSPMERKVFDACLHESIPTIQILAHGLPKRFPQKMQRAINAGNHLVITPFHPDVDRFSAARAAWCNQYALHLGTNIIIGQLSADGMLACLLSDLPENKPITFME